MPRRKRKALSNFLKMYYGEFAVVILENVSYKNDQHNDLC